jgi:hypothetical protein
MTDEQIDQEIQGLKQAFGAVAVASNSVGQRLIRLDDIELPKGCTPDKTFVLLVIPKGGGRPQMYIKPGIKVPNGREPRSTSVVLVEGESWLTFSYSFPWDENSHSLVQYIGSGLRRFALNE